MKQTISEQPSPRRKSSKRESCYGDRVYSGAPASSAAQRAVASASHIIIISSSSSSSIVVIMIIIINIIIDIIIISSSSSSIGGVLSRFPAVDGRWSRCWW